ncbi:MAG: hypothetical protein LV468_00635 [Candidatus Nitrosotenuis sp.]|jgi:hypothetical protein|uniref:hypothetical protein n=1 Tax=Candidatus Nitrosotenuis cloacae TaxID=1603555 RepID=UPI0022828449|nr:hypothetical protein [Candidatus Nitrosotenuis cloacae]MDC8437489.1 hypothetical protein [Candidatus Nitrosotenuis sp.]
MASEKTVIPEVSLTLDKEQYSKDDDVTVSVRFSISGALRDAFNEKNWTESYNKYDNLFKLKYGVKLFSGGFRKKELKEIDTYRKASIFWTRNPKLVNPMKEKRVWVQVAKNFEPFIRLTEDEVRAELFDFDEKLTFKASELGAGKHKIAAEVYSSWQKHHFTETGDAKSVSKEIEITIN